jgi:hypothetical protein
MYAVGAAFNTLYTLRHSGEFFSDFAEKAWLAPARSVISWLIVPDSVNVTVLLIAFQATVAAAILSRGDAVGPALVVGGCFATAVALFSSPGGTVGNVVLAVVQFILAAAR